MDTRTKLILAAERLFGAHGVDGAKLRAVVEAAGARKASALHYYFGSRDGLIAAVVEFRRVAVDARRLEFLRGLDRADADGIAAAVIVPLAELIRTEPEGGHYLRFLSQMFSSDRLAVHELLRGQRDKGLRRCLLLYRVLRADLPTRLARERFELAGRQVVYALADWHRDRGGRRSGFQRGSLSEFESGLIALTAGILKAPARLLPILAATEDIA